MAPRSYHHGSLRTELLQAGITAAQADGPAALAVRDLAGAVGVSPAAVYRHFPNLDSLIAEVAQQARQALAERMLAARDAVAPRDSAADTAWERFTAIGRAYIDFALDEPRLFDTAFHPCDHLPLQPDEPAAWTVLVDGVAELFHNGAITAERQREAPTIAWAAVHGLASILVRTGLQEPLGHDDAIDILIGGVRRALAP